MPAKGQWGLTDLQRLIAVIMVIVALFLAAMALGSWSLVLLLVAASLLLVAGLGVFLLGLLYGGRVGSRDWAIVKAVSLPPANAIRGRCDLRLLVTVEGRQPLMVKHRDPAVPVDKWPREGQRLPIQVRPDKPNQIRILWNLVPDAATRDATDLPLAGSLPPVFTDYAEELRAPGLEYDYSPTPTPPRSGPPASNGPTIPVVNGTVVDNGTLDDDYLVAGSGRLGGEILDADIVGSGPGLDAPPTADTVDARDTGGARGRDGRDTVDADVIEEERTLPVRERPGPTLPQPRTRSDGRSGEARPTGRPASPRPAGDASGAELGGLDVMLIVSNLKASLHFYEGLLHLPVLDATESSAVLSTGGGQIILQQMAQMSPVDRRVMRLQLRVKNVEAMYQELRRKGVTFAHRPKAFWPTDRDEVMVATCHDPDGHAVSLTEWRLRNPGPKSSSD